MQCVEPAACLIDRFTNIVGRKVLFECVLVFEWVMPLRIRHCARVEPAIDDLGHASPGPAVFLERHLIHGRAVQIEVTQRSPCQFLEFSNRTDTVIIFITVGPYRQRRTPETLTRQRPVDIVFQPFAKTAIADVLGNPFYRLVQLGHAFAKL